ncbi:Bcr/CflA family multidrug efflux MFS transporter [Salinisphaera hydrothermalis]|uniref:Bcr/CflA family efflux transporter n=1 Tax=Salinisphaera hydrothermalis (strain C41B8) TaxID=1304275 RepID=A0A084INI6_SALHC|nr:Bcr/CflA family multidrug efflux MFS transporter [Salinisphaera hydrothermalis]KEZ78270.1 Drug resistance transporter, Bcr/CflA subfamily protein [Salinisphaera hydrothermalis C41B8]
MTETAQSRGEYVLMVCVLGLLTAVAPLSIDTYLPAMPALARQFAVDPAHVQYSLSLFFVGLGFGQLLYGPISDRHGRRPVLYFGLALYLVASLACALSVSINMLIVARLVQGLGAAAGPVMARAIVRDRFRGAKAASVMSFVVMVMGAAPLIAPMIGSLILFLGEWQLIFWMLVGYSVVALIALAVLLVESHPHHRRVRDRSLTSQYIGYVSLVTRLPVFLYLACGSLMFGALFSYVAASSFVYVNQFGVDESLFGFYFSTNVVSMLIGTFTNGRIVQRFGYRTLLGVAVGNTLTCSLVLLATTLTGFGGFWGVAVPLFFLLSTVGVAGANTVAGLLDLAPDAAGAASALFGVFQFACGAIATWAVGFIGGDAEAMAIVMAGAAGSAFVAYLALRRWAPAPDET